MDKIMEVIDIKKQYTMGEVTVDALRGVTFDLFEGEFVVVLGPSGSGKSTILNIIGGIDIPTSGSVKYKNLEISKLSEKGLTSYRRNTIGFIFQFYNLIPNLTAKENILLASDLSKSPIDVDELLEAIDMKDRSDHFPSQLSGGQQQRVAIARALSKNPDILLCDEPTGALDVTTGISALRLLKNFNKEYKKTVIIITHNASIGNIADRVMYVKDGIIDKILINENPLDPSEVVW